MLKIEAELPDPRPRPGVKPLFTGRQVLASLVTRNIIEWIFPVGGQVINLSDYPGSTVRFRWNFTGTTVKSQLQLYENADPSRMIYINTSGTESLEIPTRVMAPGSRYRITLSTAITTYDPMGEFKMDKLTAPGSRMVFYHDSYCPFSTRPAK